MKVNPQMLELQAARTQAKQPPGKDSKEFIPKPYREVAQGMEEQFLEFMIQQMKNSIQKTDESSSAMDYYESLLTEQQSQQMAGKDGGIGIQDLILDQVYPEYMRTEANYKHFVNQQQAHNSYQKSSEQSLQRTDLSGRNE